MAMVRDWFARSSTYLDLLLTGTLFRYAVAHTRYFLFALFPLFQLASRILRMDCGCTGSVGPRLARFAAADICIVHRCCDFLFAVEVAGPALETTACVGRLDFGARVSLWAAPDVQSRLEAFSERLTRRVKEGGIDEIVIVGHSLGALFAVEVVARALQADPNLGRRGIALCVLTVGATIPKCTLHPAAAHIRDRVLQVAQEPSIYWAEYQARADAISLARTQRTKGGMQGGGGGGVVWQRNPWPVAPRER